MAKMVEELELGYSLVHVGDEAIRIRGDRLPMTAQQAVGAVADYFKIKDETVRKAVTESRKRRSDDIVALRKKVDEMPNGEHKTRALKALMVENYGLAAAWEAESHKPL